MTPPLAPGRLDDALRELATQLDVLCAATQARLSTRVARQLARLAQCEATLQAATRGLAHRHADTERSREALARELQDAQAAHKKLQARAQRERQDRREEKEWLAALWPDGAVLPTLLKPYEPEPPPPSGARFVSDVNAQSERERLLALVERRVARERVLRQLEAAAQWRVVVVAPSTTPEGEYVAAQTYFQNRATGESVWEPPLEMLYEPPPHWDRHKMDWEDGYALDNFYPRKPADKEEEDAPLDDASARSRSPTERAAVQPVATSLVLASQPANRASSKEGDEGDEDNNDDSDDDDDDDAEDAPPAPTNRTRPTARTDRSGDDDDGEAPDPAALREELEAAFARAAALQQQLTQASAQQRALALQLLNATRDSFEREKEELAKEDEAVKDAERRRRQAQKEEELAAKAAAQAAERKALDKALQPRMARDTVAKKDLTLAKDDEQLEQELAAFAVAQRRDRRYLAAPLARDARVKFRGQLDDEFVHMKHMEQQQLELEQTEFDLLEKTALRLEEATSARDELAQLLDDARLAQRDALEELEALPARIADLEVPEAPPSEPRPGEDVLARAKERYIVFEDEAGDGDGEADDATASKRADADNEEEGAETVAVAVAASVVPPLEGTGEKKDEDEEEEEDEEEQAEEDMKVPASAAPPAAELDPAAVARDEAELTMLRDAVALAGRWRAWEQREVDRLEALAAAYDRFRALETLQLQLTVDVALFESDRAFFEQLVARETQLSELLWGLQAKAQVERARFLVERAARDEAVFLLQDEHAAVALRLESARRLPRQAQNPLEQLRLADESQREAAQLQRELDALRARFKTEQEAQARLVMLETRFSEYSLARLREEAALFAEKQALWDLNAAMRDELVATRTTLDALRAVLDGGDPAQQAPPPTQAAYDEASALFQEKLQRREAARQFLLLCYAREERWRALAAVALVPDAPSDAWMTNAQRERQEHALAALQRQHETETRALAQQIKLLAKVQHHLQRELGERDATIEALRLEYQRSSERVRLETEQIVLGLRDHLAREQDERKQERARAQRDRARLLEDHAALSGELHEKIEALEQQNAQQRHWLTAARRELHAQRVANEALLEGYRSLEKRRATETNDMRFRIGAQIAKINGIEMWNLALKLQAREAHAERVRVQQDLVRLVARHKEQQRLLRLANWRQRVAAQRVLTDVDTLFAFFADGLALLAGATPQANDALRRNGGIDVLAALARHSAQHEVRAIAARALGEVTWNANATPRALGWRAKKCWLAYVQRLSARVLRELEARGVAFDGDTTSETEARAVNWLADAAADGEADETGNKTGATLRVLRAWNARDDALARPDVNRANQAYLGLAPGVLQTLVDLCRPSPNSAGEDAAHARRVQRNALRSLALVAMDTRNTAIVGRLDGAVALLVSLLRDGDETSIDDAAAARHAAHALANLASADRENQRRILAAGAVPLLLARAVAKRDCDDVDVDLVLASAEALAQVTFAHRAACEAVFDAGGLAALARLCRAPSIHDSVELGLFERVQTAAAQVIAHVIAALCGDQDPSEETDVDNNNNSEGQPAVARDVVRAILEASGVHGDGGDGDGGAPGVATFVLMCASCTRDVAFHGALVLGCLAQHDAVRAAIGARGGVDALFLLAAPHRFGDAALVAQAAWALANASWNRENQYRVARYLDALYALATFRHPSASAASNTNQHAPEDDDEPELEEDVARRIREHALCVLANALFYNEANRRLVGANAPWMALLQRLCEAPPRSSSTDKAATLTEHAVRALCALSYSDALALAMGGSDSGDHETDTTLAPTRAVDAMALFVRLCAHSGHTAVQQHALFGIINLCLHDANKARLLAVPHGVETLVNLSGATDRALCEPAIEALDLLADVRASAAQLAGTGSAPGAVLSPSTMSALAASDLKKLIAVLQERGTPPVLVAMACDAIADEAWKRPSAKVRLRNERGLDALLALCVDPQSALSVVPTPSPAHTRALISCLWALRNSVADNARNQDYVGALGGVPQLVALCGRHRRHDDIVEATLAALVALVMTHPRNSQELVQQGVDVLLALADGAGASAEGEDDEEEARREHDATSSSSSPSKKTSPHRRRREGAGVGADGAARPPSKENRALARELLLLLAPYNLPPTGDAGLFPPISKASSPEKHRGAKKPLHAVATTASSHLPLLSGGGTSPLAAPVSPTKRHATRSSNN